MPLSPFTVTTLRIGGGAMIWAAHFAGIYGLTALACARGFATLVAPAVMVGTLLALTAIALTLFAPLRGHRAFAFENTIAAGVAGLAAVAIVFEAVPVILIPACE
jgi:hypothetical protein